MEIFPSFDEFKNLSQGKSRVPVYKILPVTESIFNIFLKFDQKEKCAFLESLKDGGILIKRKMLELSHLRLNVVP